MIVTREEYQRGFRWAMLHILNWETGREPTPAPPDVVDIIERDANAQVRGE